MAEDSLKEFDNTRFDGLEFCSRVYRLFESIRGSEEGGTRLRMRPTGDIEKKLLEELLPITHFIQRSYKAGRYLSVTWKRGNQAYDAVLHQEGEYINWFSEPTELYLEVTCAVHPNEYLRREMLEKEGHTFSIEGLHRNSMGRVESTSVGFQGQEFIDKFATILLKAISNKIEKPYPTGTILIVQCTLTMPFFPSEWAKLISIVEDKIPDNQFSKIYVFEELWEQSHTFYPRKSA